MTDQQRYFNLGFMTLGFVFYLSWHMHQEYRSDGSLGLTITLFRAVQSISLQYAEQVLLSTCTNAHQILLHFNTTTVIIKGLHIVKPTHDLLWLQTFHGTGTVDGGPSQ